MNKLGMDLMAVGNLYEGIRLRESGIKSPIQVFGSTLSESANIYVKYDLMPTFARTADPAEYMTVLGKDIPLKVWIKMETGLGRLGIFPEDLIPMLLNIKNNTPYSVEGIYTHIGARASSGTDADIAYCEKQWELCEEYIEKVNAEGFRIPYFQVASTHTAIALPQSWSNCVCLGSALYADKITHRAKIAIQKRDAFQGLKSKLISVKHFQRGSQIGGVILERDSLIGVVPIGLGDGWVGKNKGEDVIIKGKRCKIICGISLEHTRIDLTDVGEVCVGEVVTLVGKDGNEEITVEEMCERLSCGTA